MRILIVEDQPDIRDVLREAFSEGGHSVEVAGTYQQGMTALAAGNGGDGWDLLLTDLLLPGGSGRDLALHAQGLGIRVLLCSGHPHHMNELERLGISFLRKPFTLTHMLDQVQAVMARPLPPPAPDPA